MMQQFRRFFDTLHWITRKNSHSCLSAAWRRWYIYSLWKRSPFGFAPSPIGGSNHFWDDAPAPVIVDLGGNLDLDIVNEEGTHMGEQGNPFDDLDSSFSVSDPASSNPSSAER